jgi:hypothetical protein
MSPAGLCLAILGAVTGAPPTPPESFDVDLEAKLESLVGTNLSLGVPMGAVSALFNLTPGVQMVDRWQTGNFTLRYAPLLYVFVPEAPGESGVSVLNRVNYELMTQLSHTTSLSLTGSFWYGDQNFSPVVNQGLPPGPGTGPPGTPPPPGVLPQVQIIKVISSYSQLSFSVVTSPTVKLTFSGGYVYTEGADASSRLQLPLQHGPFVLLRSDVAVSQRDTLTSILRVGLLTYGAIYWAAGAVTETGSTVSVPHFQEGLYLLGSELTGQWGHQESKELRTELAAGVAVFNQSSSQDVLISQPGDLVWLGRAFPVPAATTVDPIIRARLLYRFFSDLQPVDFTLFAALAPLLNQFAGQVYERLEGSAALDWTLSPFVRVGASGGVADTLSPQEFDVRGEVRAVWSPAASVAVALGARVAWVNYSTPGVLNGFNWTVFLSVTGATGALF